MRYHGRRDAVIARWLVVSVLLAGAAPLQAVAQPRAVWSPAPVAQTNGGIVTMPISRPVSRKSKLSLSLDTRWTQNYGYRPLEITINSPKPSASTRTILIRLYTGTNGVLTVEQECELPKGALSATTNIAIPQYETVMPAYWWDIWVDGSKDADLSLKQIHMYSLMQGGYATISGASFLAMTNNLGKKTLLTPNSMDFEVLSLAPAEFPTRWIDYSCFDAITLSVDELAALKQQHTEAYQAIRFWLRAGGHLWVNDVGDGYQRLEELSKLLGIPATMVAGDGEADLPGAASKPAWMAWKPVRFRGRNPEDQVVTFIEHSTGATRTVRDPDVIERLQLDSNYTMISQKFETGDDPNSNPNPINTATRSSQQWFVDQPVGLGKVRAFRETSEVSRLQQSSAPTNANAGATPADQELPRSLHGALRTIPKWSSRHGISPDDASLEFADLLVPGMGVAPVNEFRVLITLFVLAIGPLNYWLLRRWRRLHLMVLTVPLAAAVVTITLFAYAIVADGFGTSVRAQSLTTIDQHTGETACWSRLSYYSGMAPRAGLTMPVDVAMYPIIPGWSASNINATLSTKRDLSWEPDKARLTRGWLPARTPTQYLTVRSRKTPMKVDLQPARDRMRAKNELGASIEQLFVIDDAGKTWMGELLKPGQMTFLKATERSQAVDKLRRLVTENSPQAPDELLGEDSSYALLQRQQWQSYRRRYFGAQEHSLQSNLANDMIAIVSGKDGKEGLELPPRSYVAITSTGPEVEYGMTGYQEEKSFHIVIGQY